MGEVEVRDDEDGEDEDGGEGAGEDVQGGEDDPPLYYPQSLMSQIAVYHPTHGDIPCLRLPFLVADVPIAHRSPW